MQSVSGFIENKLKLIVSKDKIKVCSIDQIKFLGYTITKWIPIMSKMSLLKLKENIRMITRSNRGVKFEKIISGLTLVLRGWLQYFQYAQCYKLLRTLDECIRRKLRCFRLKQCKRTITMQRFLECRGVAKWQSWI